MAVNQERQPLLAGVEENERRNRYDGSGSATPQSNLNNTPRSDDVEMPPRKMVITLCITVWVPVFTAALDSTIVATLVGAISSSFNRNEQAAWLGTSYLLSVCCFSPIYGRLCDVMGRKYALLLAMFTFGIGTLLCGIAPTMETLLFARVLAGVGGGGLTTCTSTILSDVIPLRQRGLYQGLTNIVYGAGNALGGPVGGLLNDTVGWRNAFLIQIPFLLLATVLSLFFVHVNPPQPKGKPSSPQQQITRWERIKSIDALGSLTLVGSVAPILLSLSFMSANDLPFTNPLVWGTLFGGILCGFAFIWVETRFAKAPILPIDLFLTRTGGNASLANFFLSVVTHSTIYNYPLYFQAVRLQSSSLAGLHLVPNSVALSIGSVLAGLWMRKTGRYYWLTFSNSLLMVVSAIAFLTITRSTPEWCTYAAIFPHGFGVTGVLTCTLLALINSVPRTQIAVATGMSYLFRTTGQVVGVATSGVILQAMLKKELQNRLGDQPKLIEDLRHQLNIIRTLPKVQQEAAKQAYEVSLRAVFAFVLIAAIGCSLSCFMMEDIPLPDAAPSETPAQSQPNSGTATPSRRLEEGRQ
ncbi:hypothetical protein L7F22_042097 [Adiantum nelumboides]|nr:hypothetical protein [Adiantum nelumboides]